MKINTIIELRKKDIENWKPISLDKKILLLTLFLPITLLMMIFSIEDIKNMFYGTKEWREYYGN